MSFYVIGDWRAIDIIFWATLVVAIWVGLVAIVAALVWILRASAWLLGVMT